MAKYDSAGSFQWVKTFGGGINDHTAMRMVKDGSGNLYIAGTFADPTLVFGSTVIPNPTSVGLFLLKLDNAGNVVWVKNTKGYGGLGNTEAVAVAIDPAGNIFMAGYYTDSVTFGSTTLVNAAPFGSNVFLVKYNASGNVVWAKDSHGLGGNDIATSIATDGSGNIFVSGAYTSSTISFDGVNLFNSAGENMFVVKYDTSGHAVWGNSAVTDSDYVQNAATATDASGNVFVTGGFSGTSVAFGSTTLTNAGGSSGTEQIFLAKYDNTGSLAWAKSPGGGGQSDLAYSMTTDAAGNIYIGGFFGALPVTFGSTTLTNFGPFIARYNTAGVAAWAKGADAASSGGVYALAGDAFGHLYAAGGYNLPLTFDGITLAAPASGYVQAFTARFDHVSSGVEQVYKEMGDISVFPNPATAQLTIQSTDQLINQITITNLLGQAVRSLQFAVGRQQVSVDIADLPAGIYFVKVNGGVVRKFVKE